ncbi:MAG TPA: YceI family protein [Brumimicrobium sp.]|nr:YceI family protein [Brumimicrobium sp.]
MKKTIYGVLAFAVLTFTACGNDEAKEETAEVAVAGGEYVLSPKENDLTWTGSWTGGESDGKTHTGTISITEGSIVVDGDTYEGNFVIDMNSIINTDIEDETYNGKLVGHLKSDDFLNTEKFPTTKVKIEAEGTDKAYLVISAFDMAFKQGAPIKATITADHVILAGEFSLELPKATMPGLQEDPEAPENGSVSSEVTFVLNVKLDKK